MKDALMYRDDDIEGVCFAYDVMNTVEGGLQYIFVESLMNSPHVKWFDSSSDDTNKNVIEKNEHICCSSDHKRKMLKFQSKVYLRVAYYFLRSLKK